MKWWGVMAGDVLPVAMFFFLGELPWGTPVISKMDEYLKKKNSKRPLTLIPFRNICCKFCVNMRKLAYTFEAYFGDPSKQITELFGNFPKCLQPSPNLVVCQLFLKLSWVLPARIMSPASCTALSLKYVIVHICILLCICIPFYIFVFYFVFVFHFPSFQFCPMPTETALSCTTLSVGQGTTALSLF